MGVTSALARAAQVGCDHPAIVHGERTRSWAELGARIPRVAGGLRELGVGDGDRVAILALNNDRYSELFLAIPWAGGVVTPLNWRWSEEELALAVEDSEPVLLAVDDAKLETGLALQARAPGLKLLHIGERRGGALPHYDDIASDASAVADAGRTGEQLYGVFYTGGTVGRSKGVMLSHRNVLTGAAVAHSEGYYREDAVYLVATPYFHASGSWPLLSLTVSAGTAVVLETFDATKTLGAIARHGVTESLWVPTMLQMVLEHPDFAATDLSSLKTLIYGASPITTALLDRALEALPHVQFIQAYGMTELSPQITALQHRFLLGEHRARGRHRAAGRACYGHQVRIVDEDDRELPRGEVGEIVARGDAVMLGYWRRPEETAQALRGGWMHTGDGGRMDEDGFVYVVDRLKDMIITGGENVYSAEVEDVICQHPAVSACVVIGVPNETWVEQVHALVILKPGRKATEAELIAHAREHLAAYKAPRSIEFRTEPFPLSPANKILKRRLRAPYWAGRESALS